MLIRIISLHYPSAGDMHLENHPPPAAGTGIADSRLSKLALDICRSILQAGQRRAVAKTSPLIIKCFEIYPGNDLLLCSDKLGADLRRQCDLRFYRNTRFVDSAAHVYFELETLFYLFDRNDGKTYF